MWAVPLFCSPSVAQIAIFVVEHRCVFCHTADMFLRLALLQLLVSGPPGSAGPVQGGSQSWCGAGGRIQWCKGCRLQTTTSGTGKGRTYRCSRPWAQLGSSPCLVPATPTAQKTCCCSQPLRLALLFPAAPGRAYLAADLLALDHLAGLPISGTFA